MTDEQLFKLRFPIGKFQNENAEEELESNINDIAELPALVKAATDGLSREQLNWIYRPDGWTIKQVVHHLADSHMNSLIRYKWTLTEESPTIKAYDEKLWANLPDAIDDDLSNSIGTLEHLHNKWVIILENMNLDQFKRVFIHPSSGKRINLALNTALYAWHGKHHVAHIHQALSFEGKFV